jgi:hypothetical protein
MEQAVEDLAVTSAIPHRHLEGVDGEIRTQGLGDLPPHHHAREHVEDEGGVDPSGVRLDVGQVGHPETVGFVCSELAFDEVGRTVLSFVEAGGDLVGPAPTGPREAQVTHQALYGAARHADALSVELGPDLVGPIDLEVRTPDPGDLASQVLVANGSC